MRNNHESEDASITSSQSGGESVCPPFPSDEALDAFVSALILLPYHLFDKWYVYAELLANDFDL